MRALIRPLSLLLVLAAACGATEGASAALATATTAIKVAKTVRQYLCARELDMLLGDPRATEAPSSGGSASQPSTPPRGDSIGSRAPDAPQPSTPPAPPTADAGAPSQDAP